MILTDLAVELTAVTSGAALGVAVGCRTIGGKAGLDGALRIRNVWHLFVALQLLILLPLVNIWLTANPARQWGMPGWLQIHYLALYWGLVSGALTYAFGFGCGASFRARPGNAWRILAIGLLALCAVQSFAVWNLRSNPPHLGPARKSARGVVLQTSDVSCLPASAANIAAILGVQTSEQELARRFDTRVDGTYPAQALAGLKELGISGRKVTLPEPDIRAIHPPAILFFMGDSHAVVFAGFTNGFAEIWNPSIGKTPMRESRLRTLWTGHALEFWRDARE